MSLTIIGQKALIEVDHVASMLRALAPVNISADNVDWRTNAARAISLAKAEAAKSGASVASAEQMSMLILNWALDERSALAQASKSSTPTRDSCG